METGGPDIIWNQFILAAALVRIAARERARDADEDPRFSYLDTHAGSGRLPRPALLDVLLDHRAEFGSKAWLNAVEGGTADGHPGSWVLAGRVIGGLETMEFEADVNDLDPAVITAAKGNREGGWARFWSHDWYSFLRHRFVLEPRPAFVFIDPPADDPRGPFYAMDAAILLDTLDTPYMVTYPVDGSGADPQEVIDQIGRSGLEMCCGKLTRGVLLGGGAETVVLDILSDLRTLSGLLGGRLNVRLPSPPPDDYVI